MELTAAKLIKEQYRDLLSRDAEYNNVLSKLVQKKEDTPLLEITEIEPEADLHYNTEQRQLSEILLDLHSINNGIIEAKDAIKTLISSFDDSLKKVSASVQKQVEQVNDINMLCGHASVYNAIIPVYVTDFQDTSAELLDDKTLGASLAGQEQVPYDVISINGNGYSGNYFVYENGGFVSDINDCSNIEYLMDENDITSYEYSRLYAKQKSNIVNSLINYDDRPVECIITLSAQEAVCKMRLLSQDQKLAITKLETSQDGIHYETRINEPLYINDLSKIYNDNTYIYGSNTLCFPYSHFIRVTLVNDETTQEELRIIEEDKIQKLDASRKRISISGIELYRSEYSSCELISDNILKEGNVDKVSLFVSEYIPDHFPDMDYIHYFLILNGQEFPIVPVNSNKDGIRIVKYTEESVSTDQTTEIIHETIKSIQVKITIQPYEESETPYISNMKLCIGKDIGNIYV